MSAASRSRKAKPHKPKLRRGTHLPSGLLSSVEDYKLLAWVEQIEQKLKSHLEAWRVFQSLSDSGREKNRLLAILCSIELYGAKDNQDSLVGFDRKKLDTVVGRMRSCADDLDRLHRAQMMQFRLLKISLSHPEMKDVFPGLSRVLGSYAVCLEKASRIRASSHLNRILAIASLAQHVKQKTGQWRDRDVATLLAALWDRDNYGQEDQCQWRSRNRHLLTRKSTRLPAFRIAAFFGSLESVSK